MVLRGARLRFGLLVAFLVAIFAPGAASAGTAITCDDFANPSAAQYLLERDDSYADALDPDGDGLACNEDNADAGPLSEEDYIYAVWDEVDLQIDSLTTFLDELARVPDDATSNDERTSIFEEANATAARWAEYPDHAPVFEPPAGYEDIDEAYQDWIVLLGEVGEAWQAYWDLPAFSEEEDEALDAFKEAARTFAGASDDLVVLLASAEEDLLGIIPADAVAAGSPLAIALVRS